jgi:hypothetical protein
VQGDTLEYRRSANKDQNCLYCDDRNYKGYKLECDFIECKNTFHVTCAAEKQIIYEGSRMIDRGHLVLKENQLEHVHVFCLEHLDLGLSVLSKNDKDLRTNTLKRKKPPRNPFKLI